MDTFPEIRLNTTPNCFAPRYGHCRSQPSIILEITECESDISRMTNALIPRPRVLEIKDLNLRRLFVVYPGARRFDLDDRIMALPLTGLLEESVNL
jgi:hypothetical protein